MPSGLLSLSERTQASMAHLDGRGQLPVNPEFAPPPSPPAAPATPARPPGGWLSTPAKRKAAVGLKSTPARKIPGLVTPKMAAKDPRTPAPARTPTTASLASTPLGTGTVLRLRSLPADSPLRKKPIKFRLPKPSTTAALGAVVEEDAVAAEEAKFDGPRPKNWYRVSVESARERLLREKARDGDVEEEED